MHFIPTYSSSLNQVERFFSLITDKAIRRGSSTSVKQLVQRFDHFVSTYNTQCQPFKWTATAELDPRKAAWTLLTYQRGRTH
jgi:putative transposase